MRGKPSIEFSINISRRNIPAYAGKTWNKDLAPAPMSGTSPRMRGKHLVSSNGIHVLRNIPAYAGKTSTNSPHARLNREHPRVCGENKVFKGLSLGKKGTSPRMRGKPKRQPQITDRVRNIPAYAGKTLRSPATQVIHAEHPRVCGENGAALLVPAVRWGTSPRMRGKLRIYFF